MPSGYDVEIRTDSEIRFPPECVICGAPNSNQKVQISGNPIGYFGMWKWQLGRTSRMSIPAHSHCGGKLKKALVFRQLILLVVAAPVVALALVFEWARLTMLAMLLLLIAPLMIWQIRNPPPVEFTSDDGMYTFTFKNESYAKKFADMNVTAVHEEDA